MRRFCSGPKSRHDSSVKFDIVFILSKSTYPSATEMSYASVLMNGKKIAQRKRPGLIRASRLTVSSISGIVSVGRPIMTKADVWSPAALPAANALFDLLVRHAPVHDVAPDTRGARLESELHDLASALGKEPRRLIAEEAHVRVADERRVGDRPVLLHEPPDVLRVEREEVVVEDEPLDAGVTRQEIP